MRRAFYRIQMCASTLARVTNTLTHNTKDAIFSIESKLTCTILPPPLPPSADEASLQLGIWECEELDNDTLFVFPDSGRLFVALPSIWAEYMDCSEYLVRHSVIHYI